MILACCASLVTHAVGLLSCLGVALVCACQLLWTKLKTTKIVSPALSVIGICLAKHVLFMFCLVAFGLTWLLSLS